MTVRDDFTDCETNIRLNGKVALVTGSSSGLGLEVAKNLAKRGAKVIITGRNTIKLEDARKDIIATTGNPQIIARQADFASLDSIRNLANATISTEPQLDILINNIGSIGLEDKLTADKLQQMMQVNYFGTFLLTFILFPLLKLSAPSRVVNVSSMALLLGDINLDRWNEVGSYSNFGYYANAKLADVLFTVEMAERVKYTGVSVFSMDPGLLKTDFFRNFDNERLRVTLNEALRKFGRPLHRTATMSVFLAVDPRIEGRNGGHYRDCHEFYSHWSVNDTVLRKHMWEETKRLVRINNSEDWEN